MDKIGFVFIALKCEQHSLSPCGIEPTPQSDVVADIDGVHLNSAVQSLK